jgi:hypothetical protein
MEDNKPATKPKQVEVKEGKVTKRSWRPASLLDVPQEFRNPNFEYRWITDSIPGNILKKQYEGWELDEEIAPKMQKAGFLPPTPHDATSTGKHLRIREQYLARMPKALSSKRLTIK